MRKLGSVLPTILPAAAAIAVFGTLYGAGARPILGVPLTIASSLLIFSGSLQFAILALLTAGAAASALLLTAGTLNLRHLVMAPSCVPASADRGCAARPSLPLCLFGGVAGYALGKIFLS